MLTTGDQSGGWFFLVAFFALLFVGVIASLINRPGTFSGTSTLASESEKTPSINHPSTVTAVATYPTLRLVAYLLRLTGWLLVGLGVFFFLLVLLVLLVSITQSIFLLSGFVTPIFLPLAVTAFVLGLLCIAFSELIRVFVDIALNTTQLLDAVRQLKPNQETT